VRPEESVLVRCSSACVNWPLSHFQNLVEEKMENERARGRGDARARASAAARELMRQAGPGVIGPPLTHAQRVSGDQRRMEFIVCGIVALGILTVTVLLFSWSSRYISAVLAADLFKSA
jgi:hypothetical protein